jgi:hypothetical protein
MEQGNSILGPQKEISWNMEIMMPKVFSLPMSTSPTTIIHANRIVRQLEGNKKVYWWEKHHC